MKVGIDTVILPISDRIGSHRSAWDYLWANQLRHRWPDAEVNVLHNGESWEGYDLMLLDHGMELKTKRPNLFVGANEKMANKILRLRSLPPENILSMDKDMLDYGWFGNYRKSIKGSDDYWDAQDWDALTPICQAIKTIRQEDLKTEHLMLGDSHCFSMYKPGMMVSRNDGKTMHGAIKQGIMSFVEPFGPQVKRLSLYFGNIDIRHHLCRIGDGRADYVKNLDGLLTRYRAEVERIRDRFETIELISVLPIENESRVVPKSFGWYKGQPFWGSWADRSYISERFNDELASIAEDLNCELYRHPKCYWNEVGELSFDVMETPRNIHISREFYRWDLANDRPNEFKRPDKFSGLIAF